MANNIPAGYQIAKYPGFKTFEEPKEFINNYCKQCRLYEKCDIPFQLEISSEKEVNLWPKLFVRVVPQRASKTLKEKVLCSNFKN